MKPTFVCLHSWWTVVDPLTKSPQCLDHLEHLVLDQRRKEINPQSSINTGGIGSAWVFLTFRVNAATKSLTGLTRVHPTGVRVLEVEDVTGKRKTRLRILFYFCGFHFLNWVQNMTDAPEARSSFFWGYSWCESARLSVRPSVRHLCISALFQVPNKVLLLAGCAACMGGTFQYGYNVSVINAPTKVSVISVRRRLQEGGTRDTVSHPRLLPSTPWQNHKGLIHSFTLKSEVSFSGLLC